MSLRRPVSSSTEHIIDSVVLQYFLLVGEEELLGELIGWPLRVPFAVYDPEDREIPLEACLRPDLLSEMRQAVRFYNRIAMSAGDTESLWRISRVDRLYDEERLVVEGMELQEQLLADRIQGVEATHFGVKAPLGPGEAACIAIAYERNWTIVTDDADALTVFARLQGDRGHRYERIRKLLIRAANEGLITEDSANRIHADMVSRRFWDKISPFP